MAENIDTIIVGAGQAGLSTSYHLKQQGREHVVLEQTEHVADAWHKRWDSFTLITPNWTIRLPGAEYQGDDLEGFTARDDLITYFDEYIERFDLPIRYGERVISVEPIETGYLVRTNNSEFEAANVVMASGMYQQPRIPPMSANISSEFLQLHSSEYQNPKVLPEGAVLVVGSAQSGCQIAEELYQDGRKVYLSVGSAGRIPRRYRGKDITLWFDEIGAFDQTADKLPSPKAKYAGSAHGTGKDGGHTINLHQFARDGVVLLGHIQSAQDDQILLAHDLMDNLAKMDKFEAEIVKQIDSYIEESGQKAPIEILPDLRDGYGSEVVSELDLNAAGITSIVWATGYQFDFSLVKLPTFDEDGYPLQKRGVTKFPGLYFVGLPFLHKSKSGLLLGVGDDAAYIVSVMGTNGNA